MHAEPRLTSALRDVLDPEYPISLVDLGLIRGAVLEGATAKIQLTYTCMGCPAMDLIQDDIRARLLQLDEVERVEIEVVWDGWSRKDISPQGLIQLRQVGVV
ncbi:MAG: metal-sulfur cluster assembly factor [Chloroflexi bacterium OHK40]